MASSGNVSKINEPIRLGPLVGNVAIDSKGQRWTLIGPARMSSGSAKFEGDTTPQVMPIDPVKLAELIRPVRLYQGSVYRLESAPVDLARAILAMKAPPPTQGSEGTSSSPPVSLKNKSTLDTRTIFTPDERNYVTASLAAQYPQRAVGRFQNSDPDPNVGGCTGFFVGPRTVVTAAHCFYVPSTNTWRNNASFVPGKSEASEPWGRWPFVSATVPVGWVAGGAAGGPADWDFAVAELDIAPGYVGSPGWFGTATTSTGTMGMLGYPQDKGSYPYWQRQMWVKSGNIIGTIGQVYKHQLDMVGGDSGACIYQYPNLPCVGINTYEAAPYNGARKWDSTTYNFVGAYSSAW
jgi:glutamyl endopeptidase